MFNLFKRLYNKKMDSYMEFSWGACWEILTDAAILLLALGMILYVLVAVVAVILVVVGLPVPSGAILVTTVVLVILLVAGLAVWTRGG